MTVDDRAVRGDRCKRGWRNSRRDLPPILAWESHERDKCPLEDSNRLGPSRRPQFAGRGREPNHVCVFA